MIDETFYPVETSPDGTYGINKRKNGKKYYYNKNDGWDKNCKGFYYNLGDENDTRNRRVWVRDLNAYGHKKAFEDAVMAKGPAAWLAYKYGIVNRVNVTKDIEGKDSYFEFIENFLAMDSWYPEDEFFYVTDVPGFEGKAVAFQLRISNHKNKPNQWLISHMARKRRTNGKKTNQMAQFCINLMIDVTDYRLKNDVELENDEQREMMKKYRIFFYDVSLSIDRNCNFIGKTEEQNQKISDFLTKIGENIPFTISFGELEEMFGKFPSPSIFGGEIYDDINFTQRLPYSNGRFELPFIQPKVKQEKKILPVKYSAVFDAAMDNKNTTTVIDDDGKEIVYHIFKYGDFYLACNDNGDVYRVGQRRGTPTNNIIKNDPQYEIQVINERRIKLTADDLNYMVNEVIERIKRRLI